MEPGAVLSTLHATIHSALTITCLLIIYYQVSIKTTSFLQVKKLRHKEVTCPGHKSRKWQSWIPGSWVWSLEPLCSLPPQETFPDIQARPQFIALRAGLSWTRCLPFPYVVRAVCCLSWAFPRECSLISECIGHLLTIWEQVLWESTQRYISWISARGFVNQYLAHTVFFQHPHNEGRISLFLGTTVWFWSCFKWLHL